MIRAPLPYRDQGKRKTHQPGKEAEMDQYRTLAMALNRTTERAARPTRPPRERRTHRLPFTRRHPAA